MDVPLVVRLVPDGLVVEARAVPRSHRQRQDAVRDEVMLRVGATASRLGLETLRAVADAIPSRVAGKIAASAAPIAYPVQVVAGGTGLAEISELPEVPHRLPASSTQLATLGDTVPIPWADPTPPDF